MRKFKIKTDVDPAGKPIWILLEKRFLFWVEIYRSEHSYQVRDMKNHLLVKDKIYPEKKDVNKEI